MAGRNGKSTPVKGVKGDWIGFVNITLTDDEYADVDKELLDKKAPERFGAHLDYLLELGKVTFSVTNGSLVCALTVLEGLSAGYTVSSFSDGSLEALLLTRMKVQNYLDKFPDIYAGGGVKKKRG